MALLFMTVSSWCFLSRFRWMVLTVGEVSAHTSQDAPLVLPIGGTSEGDGHRS